MRQRAHGRSGRRMGMLLALCVVLLAALASCGKPAKDSKEDLLEVLATRVNEDPAYFFYNDFDSDGTYEAFAIVGEDSQQFGYDYVRDATLWFVTPDGTEEVPVWLPGREMTTSNYRVCGTVPCGDYTFLHLAEGTQTAWMSLVVGVHGGKARQLDVDGTDMEAKGFRAGSERDTVIIRTGSWLVEPIWYRDDVYSLNEDAFEFELVQEGKAVYR